MRNILFTLALIVSFSTFGQDVNLNVERSDLPILNKKIIEYVNSVLGKRVDRGECWDLAFRALEASGSYFDRSSEKTINVYGRVLDLAKEKVIAGDLIQFKSVKWMYIKNGKKFYGYANKHTAIVHSVNSINDFQIAEQNTPKFGKKVGISQLKTEWIVKGDIFIYRPVATKP